MGVDGDVFVAESEEGGCLSVVLVEEEQLWPQRSQLGPSLVADAAVVEVELVESVVYWPQEQ